jgi:hypothetical protein
VQLVGVDVVGRLEQSDVGREHRRREHDDTSKQSA